MSSGLLAAAQPVAGQAGAKPPPMAGIWRAGNTQMDVAIESWGDDCGPRPMSRSSPGGGLVNIEQNGKQLVIRSREQDTRSDVCWSRNPAIKLKSSGFANGAWTTVCKTADNDPREEQGQYTLRLAGNDALTYQDVSRYNWVLNQSRCVAKFTTTQTLTRGRNAPPEKLPIATAPTEPVKLTQPVQLTPTSPVKNPGSTTPVNIAPPSPETGDPACIPGAASRIVLRPRRAEIEVGQRVCFRARVTDDADCAVPDQTVEWTLSHSKAVRGTLSNGCFSAADTAAEGEGQFKVRASVRDLRVEATVDVHAVDLSSLIAKRMGGSADGLDDEASPEATPRAVTRVATRRSADQPQTAARKLLGVGLAIAATGLAIAAIVLGRRKAVASLQGSSISLLPPPPAATDKQPAPEPALAAAELAQTQPLPLSEPPPPSASRTAPTLETWICPQCRVGYPAHQRICPKDSVELMPYAEFARTRRQTAEEKQKRCPRCERRFPADASFCAEDGTRLVDG